MSRSSKHNVAFRSDYFEVMLEPSKKGTGPSRTLIARIPIGSTPSLEALLTESNHIELVPLTPTEVAYYLGVELKQVDDWIQAGEITTVDYSGSKRIPFWEYEQRATTAGRVKKLKEMRGTRVAITGLIHEGLLVENGFRDGHPVFAAPDQVASMK
jgi:hypothetical protein